MNAAKTVAAGLALLISAGVGAAPAERPCRDDIMKHCQDLIGQRDEMRQCIRNNRDEFSEQCQIALRERAQRRRAGAGAGQPPAAPQTQTED